MGLPERHHFSLEYSMEGSNTALESVPAVTPSGSTRPREHDANQNPCFLTSGFLRSLSDKRKNPL